jgi:hypothetical protein
MIIHAFQSDPLIAQMIPRLPVVRKERLRAPDGHGNDYLSPQLEVLSVIPYSP